MSLKRYALSAATFALIGLSAPAFAAEPVLTIKNYVGKITIETRPGADMDVTQKKRASDVDISSRSGALTIDGGIDEPDGDGCKGYYGNFSWSWSGKKSKKSDIGGYEDLDDYPNLTITGPENLMVVIDNAIPFGSIGTISGADINIDYCGKLTMADINGPAKLGIRGSGTIDAENIETLVSVIKGSGDLSFETVGEADLIIKGSGNVDFEKAASLNLEISGSGDVEADDVSGALFIQSSGSGDVSVDSVGEELTYTGRGSTDLSIDEISGRALIKVSGSGDVDIDQGTLETLIVTARGSSDVRFDGSTESADLTASGSADIYVGEITGKKSTSTSGSADIDIGN